MSTNNDFKYDLRDELPPSAMPVEGKEGFFYIVKNSARLGGAFMLSEDAELKLSDMLARVKKDEKPLNYKKFITKLITWVIDQRRFGIYCPEINTNIINNVKNRPHLSVVERADRLLLHIQSCSDLINRIYLFNNNNNIEKELGLTESLYIDEVKYLLDYLTECYFITKNDDKYRGFLITPKGYAYLDNLSNKAVDSKQAFIAMWFDESMEKIYAQAIEPAVKDAGYEPRRIDRKDHNNKIDDEIVAEIRRSRFLIADFTGSRGGVYYEAGFAHGLGLPVIFTCRGDDLESLHFDTRQYNHLKWEDDKLDEFRKALSNRISATIGDGPDKKEAPDQTIKEEA